MNKIKKNNGKAKQNDIPVCIMATDHGDSVGWLRPPKKHEFVAMFQTVGQAGIMANGGRLLFATHTAH